MPTPRAVSLANATASSLPERPPLPKVGKMITPCEPGQSLAEKLWRGMKSWGGEAAVAANDIGPSKEHKAAVVIGGTAGALAVAGAAAVKEWEELSRMRIGGGEAAPSPSGTPKSRRGSEPRARRGSEPRARRSSERRNSDSPTVTPRGMSFEVLSKEEQVARERAVMSELALSKREADALGLESSEPPGRYTRLHREASTPPGSPGAPSGESRLDRERRVMRDMFQAKEAASPSSQGSEPPQDPWELLDAAQARAQQLYRDGEALPPLPAAELPLEEPPRKPPRSSSMDLLCLALSNHQDLLCREPGPEAPHGDALEDLLCGAEPHPRGNSTAVAQDPLLVEAAEEEEEAIAAAERLFSSMEASAAGGAPMPRRGSDDLLSGGAATQPPTVPPPAPPVVKWWEGVESLEDGAAAVQPEQPRRAQKLKQVLNLPRPAAAAP